FGGELSDAAQTIVAQFPHTFAGDGRRVLLHPLPLYNNSIGALDMMPGAKAATDVLGAAGKSIRAMIAAGTPLLPRASGDADSELVNLDFLVLFELFVSSIADFPRQVVVFPAASF